jgi:hypothetical protein
MPKPRFTKILLFTLLMLLVLSGCTTKAAYNFMDWAIEWKVRRLVTLHDQQKLQMQQAVQQFHHWHRTTQLPIYADYLKSLETLLRQSPLTAAAIHAETDKIQLMLDDSINKILPDAAAVLAQLNDAQVQQLMDSVAEEREEYREDYVDLSSAKKIKKRHDEFADYFSDWVGRLDPNQKKQIRQWAESLEPYESLNLQQQKIWENDLQKILAQRSDPEILLKGLQGLMFHRTDNWQPELEQIMDRNQVRTYEVLAELLNDLSDKQRQHLHKKLMEYRQIFQQLSEEGSG